MAKTSRSQKLKSLQVKKNRLKLLDKTEKQIRKLKRMPVVTEHALLRYAERGMGFDVEAVTKEILSPSTLSFIKKFKTGKVPIGNNLQAVVRDGHVVTIENSK